MLIEIERIKKSLKKENIVPVARAFSCDVLTPVSAFLQLQKKFEKSFFLESVEGGERLGRYCFLGINPFEILKIKNGKFLIERDGKFIEDFSDLDAATVADDIVEKSEDTVSLMNNYVEQLQTPLDKQRLKDFLRTLYTEAGDVEL